MSGYELPERALAIVAHPDDVDFRCAGTLASWASRGTRVTLLMLTDGSKGSHDLRLSEAEVAALRAEEQRRAALIVGYDDVRCLGEADGMLVAYEPLLERVALTIRDIRPNVILSYDPWAPYILHPDHTVAGDVAFKALIRAREPRFYAAHDGSGRVPWRAQELWLFAPEQANHTEDISDFFDVKLEAILSHTSQYETEMGFARDDADGRAAFCNRMREMFRVVGEAAGHKYAEEFRRIKMG